MASSLSPISLIAWSQERRWYLPFTSFIGYLSRCECSVMPCSRTDAPLAQCAPRLRGESNTGSCRTHTPFCTTASMAQPTEQCVHTERLTSMLPLPAALIVACRCLGLVRGERPAGDRGCRCGAADACCDEEVPAAEF